MDVSEFTVVVATFGDNSWKGLAAERAIPSAHRQATVIHAHAETLAKARNKGLGGVKTEFCIHLDADDELEPGYVEAMAAAAGDLRVPAVRYVRGLDEYDPRVPRVYNHRHECEAACLYDGNYICIGAGVRAELLREVGGWREFPWSEDWDAWLRVWLAGGEVATAAGAVYRAHVRPDSRNRAPEQAFRNRIHREIHMANFPDEYAGTAA